MSGCQEEGIFMNLKGRTALMEEVPLYYQEVFNAPPEKLSHLSYECKMQNQNLNQSFFPQSFG